MKKSDGPDELYGKPNFKYSVANAKWWNSRFKAERMNEEREIEDAKTRHPSAHEGS